MKVTDCIICPKCQKPFLKSVANSTFGKEYFCHKCKVYFGVNELVNQFGYDAGDLVPSYPVTHANYKGWLYVPMPLAPIRNMVQKYYSEFDDGEPYWDNEFQRVDAYEMVSRMLLGIPEYDDYADLIATQENALDIGVQ